MPIISYKYFENRKKTPEERQNELALVKADEEYEERVPEEWRDNGTLIDGYNRSDYWRLFIDPDRHKRKHLTGDTHLSKESINRLIERIAALSKEEDENRGIPFRPLMTPYQRVSKGQGRCKKYR